MALQPLDYQESLWWTFSRADESLPPLCWVRGVFVSDASLSLMDALQPLLAT